jgi:carbon-monoxide dehydrogenase medium subunit
MNPFRYARPESLAEAVALLAEHGPEARLLAGGTDLLVRLRHGRHTPRLVIDLKRVSELRDDIRETGAGLRVGALAVMADLIEDERIRAHFPALVEAAGTVGSVQIRNRATLAGNLCNASPAADTAPALLVYGAAANIAGPRGARRVPVRDFFRGPGQTVLERGELVESIDLPVPQEKTGAAFTRLTRRRGVDLATVSACCLVNASGEALLAFGAVAARPLLFEDHTCLLADPQTGEAEKETVLKQLVARASPITDLRASRQYRQAMLLVMSRRALQAALARLARAEEVV